MKPCDKPWTSWWLGVDTAKVERVVLSTTLITNMIAEDKTDPMALVLIPGQRTNPKD